MVALKCIAGCFALFLLGAHLGYALRSSAHSLRMSASGIEAPLSTAERFSRAASFYRAAVPVFASYQGLAYTLKLRKQLLKENISPEEEERLFNNLHEWGSEVITAKIKELTGFYVKTGQIISTRVDIFPEQYTSKLALTQDAMDTVPAKEIRRVISEQLLNGASLDELFLEFDDIPLGSASIAQVHRAKLLDGRVVAVKVQRPNVDGKLLGDIANLKNFARIIADALPLDYYKIFTEIERTLIYELDFLFEAQATAKVAAAVAHSPTNKPRRPPVTVPLPIPGLVSKRVMVMEFIEGVALSKMAVEMKARGVEPGSPESIVFGRKLLTALTDAFSAMIFGSGIIHGDPHPGNIFIMEGGEVALLDCGQVKQISTEQRMGLAALICTVNNWENVYKQLDKARRSSNSKGSTGAAAAATVGKEASEIEELQRKLEEMTRDLARQVKSFGVEFQPSVGDDCAAATALVLFGNTETVLPGGYVGEEISPKSPINKVVEFPSEFVLLGRATVMIKGIANRLGIPWSLSDRWAAVARETIAATDPSETLPIWSVIRPSVGSSSVAGAAWAGTSARGDGKEKGVYEPGRIRFREVVRSFVLWTQLCKEYVSKKATRFMQKRLPKPVLRAVLRLWLRLRPNFDGAASS